MAIKTIQKTETQKTEIDSKIEQISNRIDLLKKQINESEQELNQYQQSLDLIDSVFSDLIQTGVLKPLDNLQNIINEQNSELEKNKKIEQIKQALRLSNQSLAQLKTDLIKLQNNLEQLLKDKDFNDNYLPFVEKFKSSYTKTISSLQKRIDSTRTDLLKYENDLKELKIWQQNQDYRVPYNLISKRSESYIKKLEQDIIPSLQNQYDLLIIELKNYDVTQDLTFKQWLIERVNIENDLKELIRLQPLYLQALKNFKNKLLDNPNAVNFTVRELPSDLPIVQIVNGAVILNK